jgi:catechol 2,3-dioxygenase-like lactoylglutathione lyase family enzyme
MTVDATSRRTISSFRQLMFVSALAGGVLLTGTAPGVSLTAQQVASTPTLPAAVGLYNWIHTTADSEKSFPFYRDVLGINLTRSPFGGPAPAGAAPERIRPVPNTPPDQLLWDLTNTQGARFRNVFLHAPNTAFGLELSEFFDIPRETRQANPWDPGASSLNFDVRDLNSVLASVAAAAAPIVTLGNAPVDTPAGRTVLVRDPDGYLIRLTQASPSAIARATSAGPVVATTIGITVADTAKSLAYYRDLLGFEVRGTRAASTAELRVNGLSAGRLTETRTAIAGSDIEVVFSEFTLPAPEGSAGATPAARPFRWRIQDVGAPQFQMQVRGLDPLIERTKAAGYQFLSVGARPIQRAFGRFVFAIDPDGVLVEYVEPTAR